MPMTAIMANRIKKIFFMFPPDVDNFGD